MSKSTLDAVYVSLKKEAREEVLKSLQPKIEKLQALGDEILTQLSSAIAAAGDSAAPAKRGPKKGAKRGPKKGAKRGPKKGAKRGPKAKKAAAKPAAKKAVVKKAVVKKAAPKKAVKKAAAKKPAAAKKSGARTPKGALENGIKAILTGKKGAVGISEIRDGLMKTATFKSHNPKTLYSQISQKIGKTKGIKKSGKGYTLG